MISYKTCLRFFRNSSRHPDYYEQKTQFHKKMFSSVLLLVAFAFFYFLHLILFLVWFYTRNQWWFIYTDEKGAFYFHTDRKLFYPLFSHFLFRVRIKILTFPALYRVFLRSLLMSSSEWFKSYLDFQFFLGTRLKGSCQNFL